MDTTTWMHVLYTKDITILNEINFNVFQELVNGFRVKSNMSPIFLFTASMKQDHRQILMVVTELIIYF